mmetsp:Transcript_55494/g.129924  ORF Transcript_55494/g.129924 Transcript_55494/m.129924 type:complete len:481 (-) Transcript_55494:54-1496(-)
MKLDATAFRYITKEEFRVLIAVEVGMKNHEVVPVPLIESLAKLNRGGTYKIISNLLRNKLLAHENSSYDGYRLTYNGFDFLALRALVMRGTIIGVGRRLGVGKESDVHYCQGPDGEMLAIKLHRLGRISFRNIKQTRDYLKHRSHGSWQYMARLAAAKEFAYMKALADEGFPVPKPVDQNRHCVVMGFLDAAPLFHLRHIPHPQQVMERIFRLLVRLARAGIIHGDFNEFNLMIDADSKVTLIDFPQIVHVSHTNAQDYFERDVRSINEFFRKRCGLEVQKSPSFEEVMEEVAANEGDLIPQVKLNGISAEDDSLLVAAHDASWKNREDGGEVGSDSDDEDEDEDEEEEGAADKEDVAETAEGSPNANAAMEALVPEGGKGELGDLEDEQEAEAEAAADADADAAGSNDEAEEGSSSNESEGPGQVVVKTGAKRVRRKQSAKEAKKNLQKEQKQKPAKPNCQKVKAARKARSEIKDYFCE